MSTDSTDQSQSLSVVNAADLLQQEKSGTRALIVKTGIKSIDAHLQGIFSSGQVIGLGREQQDDDESLVRTAGMR